MTSGRLGGGKDTSSSATSTSATAVTQNEKQDGDDDSSSASLDASRTRKIVKRMRIQIWAGTLIGFFIALCIGAAFIAVFYTKLTDLWAKTEALWEGVFSVVASVIIYLMGLAFLKMDRSRIKWRVKLSDAFDDHSRATLTAEDGTTTTTNANASTVDASSLVKRERRRARGGKWALFLLPFITVLREGLECVVFVGGVSLGIPAKSIPIAVVVGLIAGAIVGYAIYRTGSSFALHWFLIGSTFILFLIGAGLFSKGVAFFEYYQFSSAVGGDVSETGNGPGSFQVKGNVWHLPYGNPEVGAVGTNGGWQIFNAILGWNNEANLGSILSYCFYWIAIICALVWYKWKEGRVTFLGKGSAAYRRRQAARSERRREREQSVGGGSSNGGGSDMDEKKSPPESPSDEEDRPVELRA